MSIDGLLPRTWEVEGEELFAGAMRRRGEEFMQQKPEVQLYCVILFTVGSQEDTAGRAGVMFLESCGGTGEEGLFLEAGMLEVPGRGRGEEGLIPQNRTEQGVMAYFLLMFLKPYDDRGGRRQRNHHTPGRYTFQQPGYGQEMPFFT